MTVMCIDAFKNLNLAIQHVPKISPCCVAIPKTIDNLDFKNNAYLNSFRQSFSQGQWPSGCGTCKNNEAAGYESRRQGSNEWYRSHEIENTDVELVRLDYWVGDLCNLACAICGPPSSSVWKQELGIKQSTVTNDVWKQLDLSSLKLVHFNGGEPLLSKEHVQFLHAIPNKSQVYINYNTNGTIKASKELQELWEKFKLVQLDFSIDDIDARFEYQRWPANWHDVTENLQWYIKHAPHNCSFGVNTTVGILNKHNLENLDQWLKQNFNQTRFGDKIEHRKQLTNGRFSTEAGISQVRNLLDELDQRRGTSWRTVFPELVDLQSSVIA